MAISKMQILRSLLTVIAAVQSGESQYYPEVVPCDEGVWQTLDIHHDPRRGVEIRFHDGYQIDASGDEWEYVPEYANRVEVREFASQVGPIAHWDARFGVRGRDPWFRKVHPDYVWAAEWNK